MSTIPSDSITARLLGKLPPAEVPHEYGEAYADAPALPEPQARFTPPAGSVTERLMSKLPLLDRPNPKPYTPSGLTDFVQSAMLSGIGQVPGMLSGAMRFAQSGMEFQRNPHIGLTVAGGQLADAVTAQERMTNPLLAGATPPSDYAMRAVGQMPRTPATVNDGLVSKVLGGAADVTARSASDVAQLMPPDASTIGTPAWYGKVVGGVAPQVGVQAAVGVATGGAAVPSMVPMFLMEAGDSTQTFYDALRKRGYSEEDALAGAFLPAVGASLAKSGIEQMGGKEKVLRDVAKDMAKGIIRDARGIASASASAAGSGAMEEVSQGEIDRTVAAVLSGQFGNLLSPEMMQQRFEEAVGGAIGESVAAGGFRAMQAIPESSRGSARGQSGGTSPSAPGRGATPQVAGPVSPAPANATAPDDRYSGMIREATDRLRARAGGATDTQIVEAIQTMSDEDKANLSREIGLTADQPAGERDEERRRGDSDEGGVVAGGVRGLGPVEDAGRGGVAVPVDVRPVGGGVAPVVGNEGSQAGDQPGDVGGGRSDAEVANWFGMSEQQIREDLNDRITNHMQSGQTREEAFKSAQNELESAAMALLGQDGAVLEDEYGDRYQVEHKSSTRGGPKDQWSLSQLTQDGKPIENPNERPWIGPKDAKLRARRLRRVSPKQSGSVQPLGTGQDYDTPEALRNVGIGREYAGRRVAASMSVRGEPTSDLRALQAAEDYRSRGLDVLVRRDGEGFGYVIGVEPQRPGAVSAAPQAQETTNEEEGHQEGRPERLLTKKPAAPETATTGVERESLTLGSILQAFDDPDSVDTAMSEKDLADAIEAYLVNNENESLASALEQYRQNRRDHVEEFGRRDDDGADALVQAVRDEASRENVPSKLAPGQVSKPRYLHEMTLAEHRKEYGADKDALHRIAVDKAIELGHKIPASVIADYADLSQPSIPPPPAGAALAAPSVSPSTDSDPQWKIDIDKRSEDTAARALLASDRRMFRSLDSVLHTVPKGKTITSLWDGSTGTITTVTNHGDVEVRWHSDRDAQDNGAEHANARNWLGGDLHHWVVASQDEVYAAFPELRPAESPKPKITEHTIELNRQSGQSPDLDAMSPDELKAYAKSIGVPPRGSPAGIRARIRKAQADQLSAKDNPAKTDSSIPKVLPWSVSSVNDEVYVKNNRDGARVSRFGWAKVFKSGGEWTAQLFDDNGRPGEVLAKSKIKGRASAAAKEWMQRSIDRETGGQAPASSATASATQATEASPRVSAKTQSPSAAPSASTATTPAPSANQNQTTPQLSSGVKPSSWDATPNVASATPNVASATPDVASGFLSALTPEERAELLKGKTPEYDALPAATREQFEAAYQARDVDAMAGFLHAGNKVLRREFAARAGLDRVPPGVKRTRAAVESWAQRSQSPSQTSIEPVPAESLAEASPRTSPPSSESERPAAPTAQSRQASSAASSPSPAPAARSAPAPATGSPSQTQPAPAATPESPSTAAGSVSSPKSTLATLSPEKEARLAELKKRLAAKLNTELRSGFDPELFAIGAEMTALYVEKGARSFASFARQMVADLGEAVKPYLKAFYNGARDMPGVDASGMDDAETVAAADIEAITKPEPTTKGPSAPVAPATPHRVKKYREMADRLIAKAEALEKNASSRFDHAPGYLITGSDGRRKSGLYKKTNKAIEGSLNDLQKAKRLREAAGKWNARADNIDPEVIRQREQRKAVVLEAREKVKAKESAERKAAPIINEDREGVLRITADEWKRADKDYKGISVRDGMRVRTLLRGGSLHEVFITDMSVKTRADAVKESPSGSRDEQSKPRVYNGDKGSMKSLGLEPAKQVRALSPNKRSGWHYVETPDGAALVDPFDDYGVRFVAENERSGSDLLRARTEAKAYAADHPVEKKPWQMTKAEFERDHPQGKMRSFESPSSEEKDKAIEDAIAKAGVRARISVRQDPRLGPTTSIVPIPTGGAKPSVKMSDEENIRLQMALKEIPGISYRIDPDTSTITNVKINREFDMHERQVRRAHAEGLPVPDAVLKEYGLSHPAGDLVVQPISTEPSKQPSNGLRKAREARDAKTLDEKVLTRAGKQVTRRELVDSEIAEGATPQVVEITDTAAVNEAQRRKQGMDRMEGGLGPPIGNPNHPDTIKYRALEETIKNPPKKPEYRMASKGGSWRTLTKAEYDYAVGRAAESGASPAQPQAPTETDTADMERLTGLLREHIAAAKSPSERANVALTILRGEAPAVQEAVAKVLWEIAPEAADYVSSEGPIGVRGVVAKAKPETASSPTTSEQPVSIVGDAEQIDLDDGTRVLRHTLSDGTRLDEHDAGVEHWRPVGPGRQSLGQYATVDEALRSVNTRTITPAKMAEREPNKATSPAKGAEPAVTNIGKYRVFERPGEGWAVNFDQDGAIQGRRGLKTRDEAEALARQWDARDQEIAADRRKNYPMTLAEYPKVRDRIMSGDQTAEEHKELARWLMRSESAIKAELGQKTLKQLAPNGTGGNTKASIIDIIYRNMLGRFHLGDSVSYNPFGGETYESALIKKIEATTDQDIQKFKADRQGRIDARKKALENPETPDEFRQFIEKHGEAALSQEQRKRYDEVTASLNKTMRGDNRPDYIAKVDTGAVGMSIKEGFHEKGGYPLWTVQLSGRVESDTYKALSEAAKKLGGWWSSFKKDSTGFQFKSKAAAEQFVQVNQKSITTEVTDKQREEDQTARAAERLLALADEKIESADEDLGRERNTNTVRRARMADSAEASARKAKQLAETLANIAEGIQNGTAKALRGIRNMTQLGELERVLMLAQREYWHSLPEESRRAIDRSGSWWDLPMDENIIAKAVMPMPEPHISHLEEIARKGMTTPGIKREAAKLDKLVKSTRRRSADAVVVKIDNPYDFSAAKAVASRLKGSGSSNYSAQAVYDALMHHQRVADMGIKSSAEMRVALREYMGFRAGQAKPDAIREMERGLIGKTVGIDFFPTPPALATEIVEKADIEPGMKVLEPSAGNGRIADAIKAAGVVPDVAEVSGDLRAILEKKGYPLEGRDFMEFNPGPVYDRIVMNPPFSNRMDVEHVRHAYDLLKPGGRIVAIMSEGPFFGQDKKASEFRDWLDTVGTSEQLPEGSFQSDKSGLPTTGVNSRVVVIDKPQAGEAVTSAPKPQPKTPDPLHDKVMAFRERLNDATKRSDLDGMEDEARMLADAADRAGRSDLITMARGFIGQVQEKSGRLAAQEYRDRQAAKSGVLVFDDLPSRSEELSREYAGMGYQNGGLTTTLEEAQKRIRDNGIEADIAKESDGYRILRKYKGTPVLTPGQRDTIREAINRMGGLARLDGLSVSRLNNELDPPLRYLAMRYIANQDVPRVGVEAKNTAHSLMGEAPTDPSSAPDTAALADKVRKKMETEKRSRSAFYRSTGSDPEAKAKHRVEEERLKREADAMAPEIVRATEAAIGEYPGDIPNERMTKPAANTAEATEAFRAFEQANDDMEGLWAEEREIDREVASKKYGTKVREAAEKRREKLRTTIEEAKAEWTKKRDAMIRMRQEHAWNGPDLWRKLGVMTSWYPGRYSEVAAYLTKAADHLVGVISPELTTEDRGIVARDAVSNFLESPLGDSLTSRIDQKLYVFTKKANQKAAIARVESAAPLQSHERSKFIRDIENTDDKDAMDKIAAEAEAMAAERNAQEAEAERIRAEAEAKQKEANTAALTDPSKMRATTARQALGKRAQPAGSPVNGSNKLAVWMANAATKPRSQIEALGEEPVEIRGNPLTPEAMARMADSLADKATLPATLLGAVGKDGEPVVLFAYGKDDVGAVNGKMWAFANTLGTGDWFTEDSGGVLVLKVKGKPVVMVGGIKGTHVPAVDRAAALSRAGAGWRNATGPTPKTYLTPKDEAPSTPLNEAAYPSLEDLGIKTTYTELAAKADEATRAYHAALEAVSEARNKANTALTDDAILAKARAMSGDDNPSHGFTSLAIDKLINENPGLRAAQAAVEATQKAKTQADRAVESERHRAASAFKGEAEDRYRELIADRKWWQHDAEANAIERLWPSDPRVDVLRKMAESTANAREIDTTGEILPPDYKPGVGVGKVSESSVNNTTDKPSAMGATADAIGARAKQRGKANWTIELTTWPGGSSDPTGAWLTGDRLVPIERAVALAKLAPEFGADPVLTAKGDKLVWQAGNESFAFVNPWYKSAEEPGPIAQGQTVRIDVDALKNLRGKVWAKPTADTVEVASTAPAKKALTLLEKLERISSDAKDRIKQRGIQNRGRTSGATTLIDDTLDLAVVVAAEAARVGITSGQKFTALVSRVIADLRSRGDIHAERAVDEAAVRKVARGLIRDGGNDPAKLIASYAEARDAVERSRTRRVGAAVGDKKGVKEAVANAARVGRPEIAKPAEDRAKTFLDEVQRGPFREESARKAGEDAGFAEGLGVGKQLGEQQASGRAARAIMQAQRAGHRAGINQASAAIPSLIRQARSAFKRGQQVGAIESRSQIEAQKTKAATVDGLRKQVAQLATTLPPSLRGRYIRAAATVKSPAGVVSVLNRMRRDLSKYTGRRFMRGVERLAVGIPKLTEERRYEARKALTAARAAFKIIKSSGASANDLLRASTDIQAAYAEMAKHATEQRNDDKIRLVRRAVSASNTRDAMIAALGKKKLLPAGDTPGARDPGRVVLWLRKYANFRTMSYMLDSDYHGKGPFSRLYKAMARGRRLALGMQHGFQDAMEGLVRKRGYKDLGEFLARVSGTLGSASQETIDVSIGDVARNPNGSRRLTLGQAMYVYALDAATRAKAHAGQMFTFGEDPDGPKFRLTDDDFNRVEAALTADQKALVDEIKKEYDRTFFDRLSEVNKRLNGVYLDKVAGYWGIKRAMKQSDNPDVGKGWEQLVVRALHNAAMLQERIGGSAPIVIGDFGVDVLRRSESASTIVHKADLVRAIGKTALSPKVREEINARWGKTAMERLERVVIEYAGNQLPAIDQGIRGLMSNVARAKTQLNPTTWLRNISSVFMLQAVMPYSTIAKGMGGLFNVGAYRELMRYSPELRERWSGAGGQIAYMVPGATSHGSTGAIDASKATIRQVASATKALAGMNGLEFRRRMQDVSKPWKEMLDALTIGNVFDAAAATVAYKGYLAEAPATLSPEDQKRWAARRATEAFLQTSNTNDLLNSTGLQEEARSSTITAGLLAFTSDIAKKQNVLWIAQKRGWQARARATAGIAMSMAWSVLVAWAFAALLGGDDDDRDKAAKSRLLDEAISMLPGGTIIRRATSPYGSAGILDSPLTGVITQLALGMDKVYDGVSDDDSDRLRDGLFRLFQSGSDLAGAPFGLWAGMIRRAFRGWVE